MQRSLVRSFQATLNACVSLSRSVASSPPSALSKLGRRASWDVGGREGRALQIDQKGRCAANPIPPPFSRVSCPEAPTAMWQGHDSSRFFFIRCSHSHPFLLYSLSPFWFAPRCQSTPLRTISSHPDECEEVHQEGGGRGVEAKVRSGGGGGRNRLRCSISPAETYRRMKHPGRHGCLETHDLAFHPNGGVRQTFFARRMPLVQWGLC